MSDNEPWAANIAFTGSKSATKKILKMIDELEEDGEIKDVTGIEGPYESLQLMLKRRSENLKLTGSEPFMIEQSEMTPQASDEPEDDDWFKDDDYE